MEHIELEQKVMAMLLDGDDPVLQGLRDQLLHSVVASRAIDPVGFYTDYTIAKEVPPVAGGKTFHLGDVLAWVENDDYPLTFILFIRNGYLSQLEGAAFGDAWPDDSLKITLKYNTPDGKRDLQKLRVQWS